MQTEMIKVRAADVLVGDFIVGAQFGITVQSITVEGTTVRTRRSKTSNPLRLGKITSSKTIKVLRFGGNPELAQMRFVPEDRFVTVKRVVASN